MTRYRGRGATPDEDELVVVAGDAVSALVAGALPGPTTYRTALTQGVGRTRGSQRARH